MKKTFFFTIFIVCGMAQAWIAFPIHNSKGDTTHFWWTVPMVYYDSHDSLTYYFAAGFGDTLQYYNAELRYAPSSKAMRGELNMKIPIFAQGTLVRARYLDATVNDPRVKEITVPETTFMVFGVGDTDNVLESIPEQAKEVRLRVEQRFKSGVDTKWGIYGTYDAGKYIRDWKFGEGGWQNVPETTEARYAGGGITFGFDGRNGSLNPKSGYVFYIEIGGHYLLDDTLESDKINVTDFTPKALGSIYVEQFIYTPASALPVNIPLLTVTAPTTIAIRTSAAYHTSHASQLIAWKAGDNELFRGVPQRQLSGYAFYLVSIDFRIVPVTRMYTPLSLLHKIAPRTIPDVRGDLELCPFIDIGKVFGAESEKQFFSWGGGVAFAISPALIFRFDAAHCPKYDNFTTYFSVKHPF